MFKKTKFASTMPEFAFSHLPLKYFKNLLLTYQTLDFCQQKKWNQPIPMQVSQSIIALLSTFIASSILYPIIIPVNDIIKTRIWINVNFIFFITIWRERVGIEPTLNMKTYPALSLKPRRPTRTYSLPSVSFLSFISFFKDKPYCQR